ncbi:MAG: arginine deiminase-related protein [Cyclobacteriaceae bacterium]
MQFSQVPHTILMVRPAAFGFNPETKDSNAFQKQTDKPPDVIQAMALSEFNGVIDLLRAHDIPVVIVEDTLEPITTDAIFPNNWITTHEDGKVILYPMMSPMRRKERRNDVVELLKRKYAVKEIIDLSPLEQEDRFLEGTGSIIFDHPHKIAYACRSDRTDDASFINLSRRLGYNPILFHSTDENNKPVYHTNVMMWIGEKVVGICLDSVRSEAEQEVILNSFNRTGHKVIALSFAQMNCFAGNMFEVKNNKDQRFLLLSETAKKSLLPGQILEMEKFVTLLPVDISTIEESSGGSIRCMVAGIHLPD